MSNNVCEIVKSALDRAFVMGQDYWADADSESYKANNRANVTLSKFREMRDNVLTQIAETEQK